jgi:hypothetical protein
MCSIPKQRYTVFCRCQKLWKLKKWHTTELEQKKLGCIWTIGYKINIHIHIKLQTDIFKMQNDNSKLKSEVQQLFPTQVRKDVNPACGNQRNVIAQIEYLILQGKWLEIHTTLIVLWGMFSTGAVCRALSRADVKPSGLCCLFAFLWVCRK